MYKQCGPPETSSSGPPRRKERKRKSAGAQRQKFCRVHGLVVLGDAEVNMAAQGCLHDCGGTHIADGLSHGHRVPGHHRRVFRQIGIAGGVAVVVTDDHAVAQRIVFIDGVNLAVGGGTHRGTGLCGQVNAVVNPPVPGGLVVAEDLHGVAADGIPFHGGGGFQGGLRCRGSRGRRLRLGGGWGGSLGLRLGSNGCHILSAHGAQDQFLFFLLVHGLLQILVAAVVYIARDPDCGGAQDQKHQQHEADGTRPAEGLFAPVEHRVGDGAVVHQDRDAPADADDEEEVFIGRDLAHAKNYSEGIASAIDVEVKRIIDESYDKAKSMIAEYRDVLDRCAALLLEKEKITRDEFEALFDEDSKTTVGHNI